VIVMAGILAAPVLHRLLHHVASAGSDDE